MDLGAFSVSLSVKDLKSSMAFYAKLGFVPVAGDPDEHWSVIRNGSHVIGLFQGLFERNTLTFNPGWDQSGEETATFTDIRQLQRGLKDSGLQLSSEVDERSEGPGSCMLIDPDGNPVLIDQHR